MGPASVSLDDFEAELDHAIATREPPATPATPARPPVPGKTGTPTAEGAALPDRPPFGPGARPQRDRYSDERAARQRLIDADPGADPELLEHIVAEATSEHKVKVAVEKAGRDAKRARRAALKQEMSPELASELGFNRGTKAKKWAKEENVVERLEAGEIDISDAEQIAYEFYEEKERRRALREFEANARLGSNTRSIPCFDCGRLKSRPADVCQYCGDDPVSVGETAGSFNAAYGYFDPKSKTRLDRLGSGREQSDPRGRG